MTNEKSQEKFYTDWYKSYSGTSWTKVTDSLPYPSRGMISGFVVCDDTAYVIAGGTYDLLNTPTRKYFYDVNYTTDFAQWGSREPAPFNGKAWHNVDTFDRKIWVFAGGENESEYTNHNTNSTYYSGDGGRNWYEMKNIPWMPRHAAVTYSTPCCLHLVTGNNMQKRCMEAEEVTFCILPFVGDFGAENFQ